MEDVLAIVMASGMLGIICIMIGACWLYEDLTRPGKSKSVATILEKVDGPSPKARIRFADRTGEGRTVMIQLTFPAWSRYREGDEVPILYLQGAPDRVEVEPESIRGGGPALLVLGVLLTGGSALFFIGLAGMGVLLMKN